MQVVGRKGLADMLQLPAGRADRLGADLHMRLRRCAPTFFQVAGKAGRSDIFPAGAAAETARNDMIEGQIVS